MRSELDWIPDAGPDRPTEAAATAGSELVRRLRTQAIVDEPCLENALRVQQQSPGRSLARILIDLGADEERILTVVAELHGTERMRIEVDAVDVRLVERLGSDYCREHLVLPIRRETHRMLVGTADPDAIHLLDEIRARLDARSIRHVLIDAANITAILDDLAGELHEDYDVESILADVEDEDFELLDTQDEDDDTESAPVVR